MRHEHQSDASADVLTHSFQALGLEADVADTQHLVDEQHVGIQVRGDRESKARLHPRAVPFYRRVDERRHPGEVNNLIQTRRDLALFHTHDRALQVHVLATGEIRMETRGDFDQRADATVHVTGAARRPQDSRQELQRGRFTCAVWSDDSEGLAPCYGKRHVFQRPEFLLSCQLVRVSAPAQAPDERRDLIAEAVVTLASPKFLPDGVEHNRVLAHYTFSANWNSAR